METTKTLSSHAAAAKAIREELKKAFPGIKFSVRSSSFSMGDDVNISWTDGPTIDSVDAITRKYQYGHFDGMNDIYEYSNNRDDLPQTKYVITSRKLSDHVKEATKKELMQRFGLSDFEDNTVMAKMDCWADQAIYRELKNKAL